MPRSAQWAGDHGQRAPGQLDPGTSETLLRADLQEVSCLAGSKDAKVETQPPGGSPTPGGSGNPPQQVVVAPTHRPRRTPESDRRDRPQLGAIARCKAISRLCRSAAAPARRTSGHRRGGTGQGHFVVMVPRNTPPGTVYRASIEKVGTNDTISPRAAVSGGAGRCHRRRCRQRFCLRAAGARRRPATPAGGDKRCPPGQFVTESRAAAR
jgi:hypothetical protein